jgi:hypothetical protein
MKGGDVAVAKSGIFDFVYLKLNVFCNLFL